MRQRENERVQKGQEESKTHRFLIPTVKIKTFRYATKKDETVPFNSVRLKKGICKQKLMQGKKKV